jgi:hypothetical protein
MAVIDIMEITHGEVLNLAGHDRGLAARARFQVPELDTLQETVEVRFPEEFRQVSSSFFQGMFADSVRRFATVGEFFSHYRFNAPAHIRTKLADYAEQVLGRSDY